MNKRQAKKYNRYNNTTGLNYLIDLTSEARELGLERIYDYAQTGDIKTDIISVYKAIRRANDKWNK